MTDDLLYKAMQAQTAALIFISKNPAANREIGLRAHQAAQRIIDRWDAQQCAIFKQREHSK